DQEDRARAIHNDATIVLAHDHFFPPDDLVALRAGKVSAKILMAATDTQLWAETREEYERSIAQVSGCFSAAKDLYGDLRRRIDGSADLALITSAEDARRCKRQGKVGILLGAEGGKIVEDRLDNLHALYALGLRHVLLTWAFNNQLAAG